MIFPRVHKFFCVLEFSFLGCGMARDKHSEMARYPGMYLGGYPVLWKNNLHKWKCQTICSNCSFFNYFMNKIFSNNLTIFHMLIPKNFKSLNRGMIGIKDLLSNPIQGVRSEYLWNQQGARLLLYLAKWILIIKEN